MVQVWVGIYYTEEPSGDVAAKEDGGRRVSGQGGVVEGREIID